MNNKLSFASDYMEGAHEKIISRLVTTNMEQTDGYGTDEYCEAAREKIRQACGCPNADVFFLVGGTQANATVIDGLLSNIEGVITADSGHIYVHEAGAIEASGHKVLSIAGKNGKITADALKQYMTDFYNDGNHEHMVLPGMVCIAQPTEYGTLYSLEELTALHEVCAEYNLPLYVDGARLAYALACSENDVTLEDLARLTDVFYIGGTKCGTLFGEAVVIPRHNFIPHFFTLIKQHGALFAKGRILGLQFDELFTDNLYGEIGANAIREADRIRAALHEYGYQMFFETPTNQIFVVLENSEMEELGRKVSFSFWEKYDETHTAVRFATSWATKPENTDRLIEILKK